jgi:uncharacterized protein YecE (DUF72 family)
VTRAATPGSIRVGIGGWDYDPWRGTFYPSGLPKAKQLEHAAGRLTAIEVNATYYRLQRPALFEKWARTVPDGFRFAIKGSRFCTNRKVLAEAGESVERFCGQGLVELGDRLGPILWQFMPTKRFDPEDFGAFLKLLPAHQDGVRLRHAVEGRHESFRDAAFVEMARAAGVAIVVADSDDYPQIGDSTADFTYARLLRAREDEPAGYPKGELKRWASTARDWSAGRAPEGLDYVIEPSDGSPGDVFVFMINGAKVRAPAAAEALIALLRG